MSIHPAIIMFISILWGLGLATLIQLSSSSKKYKGPNVENTIKDVYKYGKKNCYKYIPYLANCAK